jgi:hypothetical protein
MPTFYRNTCHVTDAYCNGAIAGLLIVVYGAITTVEKFSTATCFWYLTTTMAIPLSQNPPVPMAPPHTRKAAATTSTVSVPPTASGRQRALSSKQQELGSLIFLRKLPCSFTPSISHQCGSERSCYQKEGLHHSPPRTSEK